MRINLCNLAKQDARVVIVGLNHVKTDYATFWNYGFFKNSGVSLGSISHVNYNGFDMGNAFFVEVSLDCTNGQGEKRKACFELSFDEEDPIFHILNRNYLNPQTGTGQAANELHNPIFFIYQGTGE